MNTHRFRALWGCVAVFLAAAVLPLSALPTRSELDAAYTDYIARHQAQELTFGNDVDVGDKLLDLAMTFVGNVEFDSDTVNQIRDDAMNAVELWNTEFKDGGADAMDVYKFMAKTVLPRLGPKELQDLNLSEKTIKWLIDNGTDVTEPLGQAAGTVAGGGSWNEVAEELALSGIDTLCPQCAVARRAVLLASEGGKWMNAWVQDQAISAEFARWEVLGNDIPIGTLAMQGPLMSSARAAIRRQTGSEPTSAEVEKFIADTFSGPDQFFLD